MASCGVPEMLISLTTTDLTTIVEHGSVVTITGTNSQRDRVTFGAEPRAIDDVARALLLDEEEEPLEVEVEEWQILDVDAWEPCCLGVYAIDHEPDCPEKEN